MRYLNVSKVLGSKPTLYISVYLQNVNCRFDTIASLHRENLEFYGLEIEALRLTSVETSPNIIS